MANTTPHMTTPTVHLNGTAKQDLLTPLHEVVIALGEAIDKAYATYPNGRDYYPQGPTAINAAMTEHADRLHRLRLLKDEYTKLFNAIFEQGGR